MRRTIRARMLAYFVLMPASTFSILSGCGGETDELPRQALSGTVKFKGEPLKSGMIQFQPSSPGSVTAGGAGIVDGEYSISKAEGLVPGAYKVSITSAPAVAGGAVGGMPDDPAPPPKEPIPKKYNSASTLNAEVKAEGPNTFDFELQAK
ncbi:hypothetical protein P12x_002919 [Tundrisphaera lichenicola]|uniref:hypothetical protein n=1 Tax=Tundrisphaera lichenicola TaxID=2029860 RepID=UPI003EBDB522